ncbi:myosin-2 heavy chain-like isoform X2 [Ptychodera flava]|uniref:myosin-2 heavy chain-like isoform X2 n=1 Tax=Ptychodera flava TaxID=63121 RepID=UPI00396AB000
MQRPNKVSALIVNEGWGSACSDGIPSINRMIASVLSDIEIDNIYSTVVQCGEREEEEAERFKVLFKYPVPEERKLKQLLPNHSIPGTVYLYLHDHFYPNLRKLSRDVKFVFGYSLTTAAEARKLKRDIFHDAELYLINVWDPDSINPEIISCDKKELSTRTDELSELHTGSHAHVLSVGKSAHEYFQPKHRGSQSNRHHYVQPNLGNVSKAYEELEIDSTFEVVSLLQPTNLQNLKPLVEILGYIANARKGKLKIKLKVIGDVSESEGNIKIELSHSEIRLVSKHCETQRQLEDALLGCHLVLANPNAHISDPSISSALSLGVPLLLPDSDDFEYMIKKYLESYRHNLLVDMNDKNMLSIKLEEKIDSYHHAVSTAKKIKESLTFDTCVELREDLKKQLLRITRVGRPKQESTSEDDDLNSSQAEVGNEHSPSGSKDFEDMEFDSKSAVGGERSPSGSTHSEEIESDGKSVSAAVAETTTDDGTKTGEDASMASRRSFGSEQSPGGSIHSEEIESYSKSVAIAVAETTTDDGTKVGEDALVASRPIASGESSADGSTDPGQSRDDPSVKAELRVASGIPEHGGTMSMVSHSLYNTSAEGLSAEHEKTRQVLKDDDPDIEVSDPEEGSIRYNVKCKTSKALQGLWQRYQSGKLRELVQKSLITPEVLSKVHAVCITMRVIIDYSEYEEALHVLASRENKSGNIISTETDLTLSENKDKEFQQRNITDISTKSRQELLQEKNKDDLRFQMEELRARLKDSEKERVQLVMELAQQGKTKQDLGFGMENLKAKLEDSEKEKDKLVMKQAQQGKTKEDLDFEMENLRSRLENSEKQKEQLDIQNEKLNGEFDYLKSMLISIEDSNTIGGPGKEDGRFDHPSGLAIDENGDLIIADKSNRRVQVMGWNNECKRKNVFDKYEGWFRPRDVAVSSDGIYLSTDHGKMQVVAYDKNNELITSFGEDIIDPYGITVSKDGYVLVNDRGNHCVKKYTKDGKYLTRFGSHGKDKDQFDFPWSVVVNSKNQILVSDQNNHRIQLLNSDGEYVKSLGSKGSGPGQLKTPYGIDVDKNDNVYVCDYGNGRIVQFSSDGEFVQNIGEGRVSPRYVAVRTDVNPLRVAVSDWDQNCVKVFYVMKQM